MRAGPTLVAWTVLTGCGACLIALPDADRRLFSFGAAHGPGPVDALGAGLLVAALLLLIGPMWRQRGGIAAVLRLNPALLASMAFGGGLGLGLLIADVIDGFWWWWLVGAVMMQVVWFAGYALACRVSRRSGGFPSNEEKALPREVEGP